MFYSYLLNFFESRISLIKKEDWFTMPNILSYIRILMIPLYIYFYLNANSARDYYETAGILVLSGITDALDGFIARKTNQITDLGKALDPLADKLTQIAVVGAMSIKNSYVLPLLVLFVLKEFYLLLNNVMLMKRNIMMDGAKWYGKLATFIFYTTMFILVVYPDISKRWVVYLVWLTAISQMISFIGYSYWFITKYKEEKYVNRMDEE